MTSAASILQHGPQPMFAVIHRITANSGFVRSAQLRRDWLVHVFPCDWPVWPGSLRRCSRYRDAP